MKDQFRNEVAIGEVTIKVVDLTEEALMQSGSFKVEGYSSTQLLEQPEVSSLVVFRPWECSGYLGVMGVVRRIWCLDRGFW